MGGGVGDQVSVSIAFVDYRRYMMDERMIYEVENEDGGHYGMVNEKKGPLIHFNNRFDILHWLVDGGEG